MYIFISTQGSYWRLGTRSVEFKAMDVSKWGRLKLAAHAIAERFCVCMYVYMYVCMYVCSKCVCVYVCMNLAYNISKRTWLRPVSVCILEIILSISNPSGNGKKKKNYVCMYVCMYV